MDPLPRSSPVRNSSGDMVLHAFVGAMAVPLAASLGGSGGDQVRRLQSGRARVVAGMGGGRGLNWWWRRSGPRPGIHPMVSK